MMFVVSFDIDGTMEFGDPPGPITVDLVRRVAELGHVVGSASDRTRGNQTAAWELHGVDVSFVGGKHHLHEVREAIAADRCTSATRPSTATTRALRASISSLSTT
jgi:hypothetical protein